MDRERVKFLVVFFLKSFVFFSLKMCFGSFWGGKKMEKGKVELKRKSDKFLVFVELEVLCVVFLFYF